MLLQQWVNHCPTVPSTQDSGTVVDPPLQQLMHQPVILQSFAKQNPRSLGLLLPQVPWNVVHVPGTCTMNRS